MHTKKRWIWTNTTLIMASMLGVDYKYDCTTIAVTSIHLSVYYFYVHLYVHVLYIHVQLSTITIHVQLCTITRCITEVYHGVISSFPTIQPPTIRQRH